MCRNVMKQEAISVIAGDVLPAVSKLSAYIQQVITLVLKVSYKLKK